MKKLIAVSLLVLAATGLAASLEAKPARKAAPSGFDSRFTVTSEGNTVMGSAAAPIRLVEFISYSCPHCAHFNADSAPRLRGQMVRQGKVSVELRPIVRGGARFDMVASLLALCGPVNRHFDNSDAILASQPQWLDRLADPAVHQRWDALPEQTYNVTVAKELGLYAVMQKRGFTPLQIDACLADKAKAAHITRVTDNAFNVLGVQGTPSFMLNDSLYSVYDWGNLEVLIESMLPQ